MEAYGLTDKGVSRMYNQDYLYSLPCEIGILPNLFIVADGMGGHRGGDYASMYAVTRFVELVKENSTDENRIAFLSKCLQQINNELYEKSINEDELHGMGTTFVSCFIDDGIVYTANVGDSRLYIINDKEIRQITHDHSLVEELVASGSIERDSSTYHKKKNVITRAIGAEASVCADFFEAEISEGDVVLLCSDGLTNMLSDDDIKDIVNTNIDLESCARELVHRANCYGGLDNISVIVVR